MALRDGGPHLRARREAEEMLDLAQLCREAEDAYLRRRQRRFRELPEGVPPHDLRQAGWGVIYAPAELERAGQGLQDLLTFREEQADPFFKSWSYEGQKPRNFLYETLEASPGTIDPKETPYYLLLVGSPEQIPFDIQHALSVNFAVGRLYFENAEHYGLYAKSVKLAEEHGVTLPHRLDLFAAENPGDRGIEHLVDYLVEPLLKHLPERDTGWQAQPWRGADGTREKLLALLRGDDAPGVLLAASHGLRRPFGDPEQEKLQGALSCPDGYLAAADLADLDPRERRLHGLIAWFCACYGAGTPCVDGFPTEPLGDEPASEAQPRVIAEREFAARVPQALLANGALAVVGHVDRGWTLSFRWLHHGQANEAARSLEDSLVRLLNGHRLGHALRPLSRRYSAVTAQLVPMLEAQAFGLTIKERDLRVHKVAATDARGYIVLGDPAVYALGRPSVSMSKLSNEEQLPTHNGAQPVYLDPELILKIRDQAEERGQTLHQWIQMTLDRQIGIREPTGSQSGLRDGESRRCPE